MARDVMAERVAEAERIIRAQNRLIDAMYNSDLEASWPHNVGPLLAAYEERYDLDLSADAPADQQR